MGRATFWSIFHKLIDLVSLSRKCRGHRRERRRRNHCFFRSLCPACVCRKIQFLWVHLGCSCWHFTPYWIQLRSRFWEAKQSTIDLVVWNIHFKIPPQSPRFGMQIFFFTVKVRKPSIPKLGGGNFFVFSNRKFDLSLLKWNVKLIFYIWANCLATVLLICRHGFLPRPFLYFPRNKVRRWRAGSSNFVRIFTYFEYTYLTKIILFRTFSFEHVLKHFCLSLF
jgi:hypothetical protein